VVTKQRRRKRVNRGFLGESGTAVAKGKAGGGSRHWLHDARSFVVSPAHGIFGEGKEGHSVELEVKPREKRRALTPEKGEKLTKRQSPWREAN